MQFCSPSKLSIVYQHRVMKSRSLFFQFDSVHMLKCIKIISFVKKIQVNACCSPNFLITEILITYHPKCSILYLTATSFDSILKNYCKLTSNVYSPPNLERQNVNLVLQIFNESTI